MTGRLVRPLMKFDVSRRGSPSRRSSPSGQELAEERLHLQPRERRAEAEVRALPEREVVVGARGRRRSGTGRGSGARRRWPTRGRRPPCRPPGSPGRRARGRGWPCGGTSARVGAAAASPRSPTAAATGRRGAARTPSGCRSSRSTPPGSALRTVSLPAITSRKKNIFSSASVSRSPSTSAVHQRRHDVVGGRRGACARPAPPRRRTCRRAARASAGSPASRPAR